MRAHTPAALALALLLTGCTAAPPPSPTTPSPSAASATAEQTPAGAGIAPAFTTPQELEKLPWVSTYAIYDDEIPTDPQTPFRHQVAKIRDDATFAIAYTNPGGRAFAKIGEHELSDTTSLPVIHRQAGWVLVLIPGRLNLPSSGKPVNGAAAWIPESQVDFADQPTEVVVDLAASEVSVMHQSEVEATYPIIMDGQDLTASGTRGFAVSEYFTAEKKECSTQPVLAVSTQSEIYDSFVDGVSLQAIHGWSPECRARSAQTARTSGCINLSDQSMADLLARVTPGTPITFKGRSS